MNDVVLIIGGLLLLIAGGEGLIRGAVAVATRFGMSPLLIGLVLVGFGTSTPELVTSIEASMSGAPGIAIGNIVGSNIANILLILGIAALATPITVGKRALARDGLIMIACSVAFVVVGRFLEFDRMVGAAFVAALCGYLFYAYRQETAGAPAGHTAAFEKREAHDEVYIPAGPSDAAKSGSVWGSLLLALGGLAAVIFGGKLLVDGAVGLARSAGISETVIGLTIVAVGTSLPELVTSVVAAFRGHSDVALGNILGSNIYNILGIGGATALIAPTRFPPEIVSYDNFVMLGAAVVLVWFANSGYRISRVEGAALLACYGLYVFSIWPM
ncbi:MAG TPA: calcium/sodium antiporter [Hyphomicrobiaceae bacterium]|nr:calcium/sodium antiporter [Hyphomicrobiaceae bacterium]